VSKVLVTIQYAVEPAKRDAYLAHVREMREHATEMLKIDYQVFEDVEHPCTFTEVFACASREDYEALDERQDDVFRGMIAKLDVFTDLTKARYSAIQRVV
jgi:quinol monooxygenase YgiN